MEPSPKQMTAVQKAELLAYLRDQLRHATPGMHLYKAYRAHLMWEDLNTDFTQPQPNRACVWCGSTNCDPQCPYNGDVVK